MSSTGRDRISGLAEAPYIGALLRLAHQVARARLLQALAERGLGDINQAYFSLFQYPSIDGMRPSEVARRLGISKQALNHLLGQVEKLGYLKRHCEGAQRQVVIRLTPRGWRVIETNIAAVRRLEADWQRRLGRQRFTDLKQALRELTGVDGPTPVHHRPDEPAKGEARPRAPAPGK
ncbi:MAG TPA: MarR family winged helix-turn-helix transcriptional regulator [Candidatus Binataceae bacterium]|nr:MarR family winged helix-turn-helix transcriptional regulator [Candidatus Binataceae bacterium]